MSLVWLFVLDLMLSLHPRTAFPASHIRRPHLSPMTAPSLAQGTSRSIVRIRRVTPDEAVARDRHILYSESLNSSISDPHWKNYNIWQALSADGRANFCLLFFIIYISYLIYVLF